MKWKERQFWLHLINKACRQEKARWSLINSAKKYPALRELLWKENENIHRRRFPIGSFMDNKQCVLDSIWEHIRWIEYCRDEYQS